MEEKKYTGEPTSGDRLRRYNSKNKSLPTRRETGKADSAGRIQSARIRGTMRVENCVQIYERLAVDRVVVDRMVHRTLESGLCLAIRSTTDCVRKF